MNVHTGRAEQSLEDLVAALHEHAAGLFADTAAIDLLTRHHTWLARPEFHRHIQVGRCQTTGAPVAYIRWRSALAALAARRLPCSTSEADVLRIAAALGADIPLHLRRVLGGFDRHNIGLVTDAITLANGT